MLVCIYGATKMPQQLANPRFLHCDSTVINGYTVASFFDDGPWAIATIGRHGRWHRSKVVSLSG